MRFKKLYLLYLFLMLPLIVSCKNNTIQIESKESVLQETYSNMSEQLNFEFSAGYQYIKTGANESFYGGNYQFDMNSKSDGLIKSTIYPGDRYDQGSIDSEYFLIKNENTKLYQHKVYTSKYILNTFSTSTFLEKNDELVPMVLQGVYYEILNNYSSYEYISENNTSYMFNIINNNYDIINHPYISRILDNYFEYKSLILDGNYFNDLVFNVEIDKELKLIKKIEIDLSSIINDIETMINNEFNKNIDIFSKNLFIYTFTKYDTITLTLPDEFNDFSNLASEDVKIRFNNYWTKGTMKLDSALSKSISEDLDLTMTSGTATEDYGKEITMDIIHSPLFMKNYVNRSIELFRLEDGKYYRYTYDIHMIKEEIDQSMTRKHLDYKIPVEEDYIKESKIYIRDSKSLIDYSYEIRFIDLDINNQFSNLFVNLYNKSDVNLENVKVIVKISFDTTNEELYSIEINFMNYLNAIYEPVNGYKANISKLVMKYSNLNNVTIDDSILNDAVFDPEPNRISEDFTYSNIIINQSILGNIDYVSDPDIFILNSIELGVYTFNTNFDYDFKIYVIGAGGTKYLESSYATSHAYLDQGTYYVKIESEHIGTYEIVTNFNII